MSYSSMIPSYVMRAQKLKLPLQYDYQKINLLIQAGSLKVDYYMAPSVLLSM